MYGLLYYKRGIRAMHDKVAPYTSMKSKFEFKFDIEEKKIKYPSYIEILKLNLNKSTLPRKYPKSNQIYFAKNKFKYQSKLRRNIQTISIKVNPQNKLEKGNQSSSRTNSSVNLAYNYNYQPVQKGKIKFRMVLQFLICKPIYPILERNYG